MAETKGEHIELNVKGMTCSNCALGIEKYLKKEGLSGVAVDFASEEVNFEIEDPNRVKSIIKGIEKLGYEVVEEPESETSGMSQVEKFFWFCLVFTIPLVLHMVVPGGPLHNPWVQLALATPVFLVGMYHFGRSAISSLRGGVPNMDVLITMGALAAYGYSLYGAIFQMGGDFLFFETAASIITIVLLGNLMEHKAVQRTTSAVRSLSQLQPARALRYDPASQQLEEVMVQSLAIGDILQVNEGDRIPVDGEIIAGQAEIDESMVTGESLPQMRSQDEEVVGGTLVTSGQFRMKVQKVGKGTVLSQIIDLVKKAQGDKPNIQQLADKISAVFVPAVISIALVTLVVSLWILDTTLQTAMLRAVAVLVIACPCAMGLATPTAVVVGIGRASRAGILIKGGRTLEQFAGIKRIVFDKTGTLTTGEFKVQNLDTMGVHKKEAQSLILALEQNSSHPIARALQGAMNGAEPARLTSVREEKGLGMFGRDSEGNTYALGSKRVVNGQAGSKNYDLYLLKNDDLLAGINLEDSPRPGAREVIQDLHQRGIETILVSGDRQEKCDRLAEVLGIKEVFAEQLPDQKLGLIEEFAKEKPTAMVGDGINDAPALARATVGVSLGSGTAIAMESAQVVLPGEKLELLSQLIRISEATMLTIKQNLFWAFFYNVVAIPFAAAGYLKPILAALAMAFSDVIVIGNSLRLKVKRLK